MQGAELYAKAGFLENKQLSARGESQRLVVYYLVTGNGGLNERLGMLAGARAGAWGVFAEKLFMITWQEITYHLAIYLQTQHLGLSLAL